MKTALIVLTDAFPYEVGEEFFEQELPFIQESADQIFFIPMRLEAGAQKTRKIPAHASSLLPAPAKLSNKWLVLLRHLPSILNPKAGYLKSSRKRTFKYLAMDLRFFSNAIDIYKRLRSQLIETDLKQYDSVVIYSYWFYTGVVVANLLKDDLLSATKVKLISRAHAYDVDEDDTPNGYIPGRDFLLSKVDFVFPISNYAARFLTDRFPQYASKVKVKRLGVPKSNRQSPQFTQPTNLISISHMAGYKRVHLIADAVEELEKQGYLITWTHIGEFQESRFKAMQNYIAAKKLSSRIRLTGHLSNQEVQDFLNAENMHIFINSSSGEGVPVTIMEALANGIPVVATRAGGTAEIVHHEVNGRTLPVECSGKDIANEIAQIIAGGITEYEKLSARAKETWDEYANAEKQYSDMNTTITHLLKD
ncbi:glycosyltransferase [Gleimia sp. 6138-11-ORH1]|uniref:glycosyltransferase n=1 Tax=Gleimia sp. 6138-11-ORH1 TaxID=2973937 RepID=UPI002169CF32|nr:glycosyltransferase [Gleimia sp. 6138-11-ORH1]MCS4484031.1 glycosyltransferase [Gleimia sp. 6138-11-ORH1]